MNLKKYEDIYFIINEVGRMPTIRITEDHLKRLEALAVKRTDKEQKIVTIAKALEETLEKNLPKNK
jgi:hypothetical protein